MYITDIEVNNGRKFAMSLFDQLQFLRVYPWLKPHILFSSNHLAIWHSFPDINHLNVNNGLKLAILNLIELISRAYPSLKPQMV